MHTSLELVIGLLLAAEPGVVGSAAREGGVAEEMDGLRRRGSAQYAARSFGDAAGTFAQCAALAERVNRVDLAIPCWNNAGGANLAMLQFGAAMAAFFRSRELSQQRAAAELEAVAETNLAAVYLMLGDADATAEALRRATTLLPAGSRYLAYVLGQRARLAFRQGDHRAVLPLLTLAVQEAEALGDMTLLALLWDDLAAFHLNRRDLAAAEEALSQEYRIRLLFRPLHPEYAHIRAGRLKMAQGKPLEALAWFDRAEAARRGRPGPYLPWIGARDRSTALEAAGRIREALAASRQALRLALDWRQDWEKSLSLDIAGDVSVGEIATDYARLADRQGEGGGSLQLAFLAVEQARAAGLRQSVLARPDLQRQLGPAYREVLGQWRAALLASVAGSRTASPELPRLQSRLNEAELRAGFSLAPQLSCRTMEHGALAQLAAAAEPGQALFSFLLAEPASHLWTLSDGKLTHHRLPGRGALNAALDSFSEAVAGNAKDLERQAESLFRTLFGSAPAAALAKPDWLLSLDDSLLHTPLAALRMATRSEQRWLGESRSLSVLPSALWLLQRQPKSSSSLLAVGDAIHNLADPRWPGTAEQKRMLGATLSFWLWPSGDTRAPVSPIELPALPGSRREIKQVAALWNQAERPWRLLAGPQANQNQVEAEFGRTPGVVHFATHVLPVQRQAQLFTLNHPAGSGDSPLRVAVRRPDDAFLALSMTSETSRDGILAGLVPSYRLPGSLIVLSGCGSGLGTIQPGAGLAGFTRAWISAGARGVVSSLWPVADDSGTFFISFYRSLLSGSSSAKSLKAAQTAMIQSRSWRAQPRYWAAYFLVGKE